MLDGHGEFLVKHVEEDVSGALVGRGDGKVVNLLFEDDAFAIDKTGIQARFMDGWGQSEFTQDRVGVFFPRVWATRGIPAWWTGPE